MKLSSLISRAVLACALCAGGAAFADELYFLGAVGSVNADNASTSGVPYKLQLGYQINPNFAVEGGYVDLGKLSYTVGSLNTEGKFTGGSISALGIWPLGDELAVFGKLGYNSYTTSWSNVPGRDNINSGLWGLGGMYKMTKSTALRLEYEKIASDTSMTSLGFQFSF